MGLEFLKRVQRVSIISGVVLLPILAVYLGWRTGTAWALGCAWSLANLVAIEWLIRSVATPKGDRDKRRVTAMFLLKVPILYGAGFVLLKTDLPVPALLAGFMWPLGVMVLKALGRMVLRLDRAETAGLQTDSNTASKP